MMFPVGNYMHRRLITATPTNIVAERRLTAVTHPIEIGNTSEASRRFGVSRQSVHSCRALLESYGTDALVTKTRRVTSAQRHSVVRDRATGTPGGSEQSSSNARSTPPTITHAGLDCTGLGGSSLS